MQFLKLKFAIIYGTTTFVSCNQISSVNQTIEITTPTAGTSFEKPIVKNGYYYNLNSGEKVKIIPDSLTGLAIDSSSNIPVEFYFDKTSRDTFYQTGLKVNSLLLRNKEGLYILNEEKVKINGNEIIILEK